MLRLFVGIEFPPELKLRLSLLCAGIPGARWIDPGNLHLTLRFIGEITEDVAADVDEALAQLRRAVSRCSSPAPGCSAATGRTPCGSASSAILTSSCCTTESNWR